MVNNSEKAGQEVPKEYRAVCNELVDNQGWRYDSKGKYPHLFPADKSQTPVKVPKTPSAKKRSWENWIAEVRRKGGVWPPEGRK